MAALSCSSIPHHLPFSRRSSSQNTASPSPSPSRSRDSNAPRLNRNRHHVYSTTTAASSAATLVSSPLPPQIPLPKHFAHQQKRRKALDISSPTAHIPEWAAEARPEGVVLHSRGRDKVPRPIHHPYSPHPTPTSSSSKIFTEEDDESLLAEGLARSEAWRSLMARPQLVAPQEKGKRKATDAPAPVLLEPTTTTTTAPVIAILAATYQSQSPLSIPPTLESPPLPRTTSLSPTRYTSSSPSSSSSSTSSTTTSSPSVSPSSSTSTFITDPDNYSPPATSEATAAACLSPRCRPLLTLPSTDDLSSTSTGSIRSTGTYVTRVPYGRDPLTRLAVDCSSPVQVLRALTQEPHAASPSVVKQSTQPQRKRGFSFLYSALETLAGAGRIMVDSYAVPGQSGCERDSLGLEKATLSPTDDDNDRPSPCSTTRPKSRPRNHTRRRSLRHVSSDPILYHHHARAPSVQRRKQAFGPLDVKPYGYRVGPREVGTVFSIGVHLEEETQEKETEKASVWDYAMLFSSTAMMLEGEMVANTSGRKDCDSSSTTASTSGKRPPSPPASAIVALQRYPIIPYNPPGPGVSAADEVFPKIRDRSQGRLWYLDLVPGGSDGRVDEDVPLSNVDACPPPQQPQDEATELFKSFPDPSPQQQRYAVRSIPSRRTSSRSRSRDRERSPSPQRGRARTVRPVRSTSTSTKPPCPSPHPHPQRKHQRPTPSSTSSLSSKHFRAPPVSDVPSMYLVWALKGVWAAPVRRRAAVVNEGREGREGVLGSGVDGLKGSARRRVGGDGRVRSALRWEVVVFDEDEE